MSNYDFHSLSSQDFEELARDLLQKEWNVHIESFKEGKDQGIDLRHSSLNRGSTIIQCKHYIGSGFKALVRDLKKKEVSKVKHLSPRRYVLVTSVALTPLNKTEIRRILDPFIITPTDIIGQNDLNNLLSKYPDIETKHFKLWLTSKAVLERVLKNAISVQSDFKIDKITRKLPLYVHTSSLQSALKILEENRFLIISGIPGIGKTTLAEILLYIHLELGYAPIQVTENIKEAFDLYYPNTNQIFYYDDFLGQTMLHDRFGKNEDAAIIEFIDLVRTHKKSFFIMTTREYILQSANLRYEKIAIGGLDAAKYILKLSDYSKRDKARILYNHLYFSDLPAPYIYELLNDKFYLEVIDHQNFSPRIIEWMANMQHLQNISVGEYKPFFKRTLDRPQKLWAHAFDNQIEVASQILLLSLYSLGSKAHIDILRDSFLSTQKAFLERYNLQASPKDFPFALKELEGTFTVTKQKAVEFHNPSVKDFLELKLSEEPIYIEMLLSSALYFRQVANLWNLSCKSAMQPVTSTHVNVQMQQLVQAVNRTLKNKTMVVEVSGGVTVYWGKDTKLMARASKIIEILEKYKSEQLLDSLNQAIANIVECMIKDEDEYSWSFDPDGFNFFVSSLIKTQAIEEEMRAKILRDLQQVLVAGLDKVYYLEELVTLQEAFDKCTSYWADDDSLRQAFTRYLHEDFMDECSNLNESYQFETLAGQLDRLGKKFDIDVSRQLTDAYEKADECAEEETRYADEQYDIWKDERFHAIEENEGIEDMFNTLRER